MQDRNARWQRFVQDEENGERRVTRDADVGERHQAQDDDALWRRFVRAAARLQGEPGRQRRWAESLPGPELSYCAAWGDGWRVIVQAALGDRWLAQRHPAEMALAQVCIEVRDRRRPTWR